MVEAWTAEDTGQTTVIPEADVLTAFDAVKVADEQGNEGAHELDVLNYWRQSGIGGREILAFSRVPLFDSTLVKTGAYVFGGLYIGLQLPASAAQQEVWDWNGDLIGPNEPRSWGGHAVDVVAYDPDGLVVVTWGHLQKLTWSFWERYCDEAYCIISNDFLGSDQRTPDGVDLEALNRDLALVTA
jgi:hypothetical protein